MLFVHSRQARDIKALWAPLFHRAKTGRLRLVPTDAAERVLPELRVAFDRLSLAIDQLRASSTRSVLTVTASPAFAAKWLLPRLENFQTEHPEIDILLDTSLRPVDFVVQRVDIGVRYGSGHWPGLQADKLFDEEVFPVCAPLMTQKEHRLTTPQSLLSETLIHDLSMVGDRGFPTWDMWLSKAGVASRSDTARSLKINSSAAVLQAAIDGHGVALARSVMVRDDLAAGRLVRLFPSIRMDSPLSYYVVYRADCAELPRIQHFRQWLLRQAN